MPNGFLTGLVAHWDMEDTSNITDVVNGWDLQGATGPPTRVTGKLGSQAADFPNTAVVSQDLVGRATLNLRQNPMVSFTVQMWVKFNNAPKVGGSTWIWEEYDGAGNEGFGFVARGQNDPDDWAFFFKHGAGTVVCASNTGNISSGVWYHCVIVYDASTEEMALYINNDKTTQDASGLQVETAGDVRFTVGGWHANGTEYADAAIDDLTLWNRAFTAAEVEVLYNSGNGLDYSSWDSGAFSPGGSEEDLHSAEHANEGPLFSRVMEVVNHLQANPLDTGDAAITVMYRQVRL